MTQFQFDLICKIIDNGAPALANELIGAISGVINEVNSLRETNAVIAEENAALKAELTRIETDCDEPCHCDCGDKCCKDEVAEG